MGTDIPKKLAAQRLLAFRATVAAIARRASFCSLMAPLAPELQPVGILALRYPKPGKHMQATF